MSRRSLVVLLCLLGLASVSLAGDALRACVKYQRSDGSWSHGYKVRGFVLKKEDLSARWLYAPKPGSHYFLVRWKKGGWSLITLDEGFVPERFACGEDQGGKRWRLKRGWASCE